MHDAYALHQAPREASVDERRFDEHCEYIVPLDRSARCCFRHETAAVGPLDEALEDLEYGDWSRAFEVLVPLADAGDCEAARLSLMMHEHGARLFGGSFAATPSQYSRWLAASQSA